ncbi:hypothetical protein M0R45_021685 [Rubus argutus]|uniref:Uncharacterized protein n=1 Tax=Rubus argutus TaxID=59490 RepID=A0AAW1XFK9_RUBAR
MIGPISRDPEFWKDPQEFIPERFDDSCVDFKGQHFEFLHLDLVGEFVRGCTWRRRQWSLDLQICLYCFDWKCLMEWRRRRYQEWKKQLSQCRVSL